MRPDEDLLRCYDCGIRYVGVMRATTSMKDELCPVCLARQCAPRRSGQHQTTPGVVTYLTIRN